MRLIKHFIIIFIASVIFCSCRKEDVQNPKPQWNQIADFPAPGRMDAIAFSIDSKGYLGLGFSNISNGHDGFPFYNDLWEYEPDSKFWTKKADFPGTLRSAATGFSIGDKGYVVNGLCSCNDFWEYNPSTDTWTKKADFPVYGLYYTASFTINGKAYVTTGIKDHILQRDLWEYDPSVNKWTKKKDFPGTPVKASVGFSIGNKGYIATGDQAELSTPGAQGKSKEVWQYDPASDTWTRKADFPYETYSSVGFSINNKGYLGLGLAGTVFWEYDPNNDAWSQTADFKGGGRSNAKAFVINNKAYVGLGAPTMTDMWTFSIK